MDVVHHSFLEIPVGPNESVHGCFDAFLFIRGSWEHAFLTLPEKCGQKKKWLIDWDSPTAPTYFLFHQQPVAAEPGVAILNHLSAKWFPDLGSH
jgi:hypothetical protein